MPLRFGDRVQETFTTTGTGTISLGGAVTGYQAFSVAMNNSDTAYYAMTDGTNWEIGLGTYSTAGNTLARTTVLASSNGGSAVNWSSGTKNVWLDFPATLAAMVNAPNVSRTAPQNPTGTSSNTGVMMGLAAAITPNSSGVIGVTMTGWVSASATSVSEMSLRYGTGTAPTHGAAATGTQIGPIVESGISSAVPFACNDIVSGLTVGTAYWFDLDLLNASSNTSTAANVNITLWEIK